MAQLINEAKRMQQLAGILKEAIGDDTALNFSNTKPNTPPGAKAGVSPASTINTSDEMRLKNALELSNMIKARLRDIGDNPTELDGFFKIVLDSTSVEEVSKAQIIAALNRALKEFDPEGTTITTSTAKAAKK